jgi:hypothetical protein
MATGAFMSFCAARDGRSNLKKTHRIYNELGLQLRNKTPKRRVKAKLRDDRRAASTSNEIWAMDFVHEQVVDKRWGLDFFHEIAGQQSLRRGD